MNQFIKLTRGHKLYRMKKKRRPWLNLDREFFMNRQFKTLLFMVSVYKRENNTYLKLLSKKKQIYFLKNCALKFTVKLKKTVIGLVWKASNLPKASKHKKERKESLAEKKPFPTH